MVVYSEDEVVLTQEACRELIIILKESKQEIFQILSEQSLISFYDIYSTIKIWVNSKEISNRSINIKRETLDSGILMAIIIYILVFLISKGIEKKIKLKISKQFYMLLPYSNFNNITSNLIILGYDDINLKYRLNNKVPLLINSMYITGNGSCPFVNGEIGKRLNSEVSEVFILFLEELYSNVLSKYENTYEYYENKKTPDFVNYLLGRFEDINLDHIKKYPNIFEPI